MSKFNEAKVNFRANTPNAKLTTVSRIRVAFKYPPSEFKVIVHKEDGVHDIIKKYTDF